MGILDDVVINAKSAAHTVGKMAGQSVDMSKLRINSFELNINTATEEEIHKFEKNTSIHYIGAVEKTIQFEIFTDSKLENVELYT